MTLSVRYRTPGVYFERPQVPPGLHIRRTDVAGFLGIAQRGPLHKPTRVESPDQFRSVFGSAQANAYLSHAVEGFFQNGGVACYVVRVADPELCRARTFILQTPGGGPPRCSWTAATLV